MDISPIGHEQLSKFYLLDNNPEGSVPVPVSDEFIGRPMPESFDLTAWYPSLL